MKSSPYLQSVYHRDIVHVITVVDDHDDDDGDGDDDDGDDDDDDTEAMKEI